MNYAHHAGLWHGAGCDRHSFLPRHPRWRVRAGFLWPVGDAAALTAALDPPLDLAAAAARQWFEEHWTYAAIGRRALWAYIDILGRLAIMLGLYR